MPVFPYFIYIRFIVYKVPKLTNARKYPVLTTGTEFFYMDTTSPKFNYKTTDITSSTQNPVYETLKPLYTNVSVYIHVRSSYVVYVRVYSCSSLIEKKTTHLASLRYTICLPKSVNRVVCKTAFALVTFTFQKKRQRFNESE